MGIDVSTEIAGVAAAFDAPGELVESRPLVGGHINDSYLVTLQLGDSLWRYLLQRINDRVLPDPEAVVENILHVTQHLTRRLKDCPRTEVERSVMRLVPTTHGGWIHRNERGAYWRMLHWIEGARTIEVAVTPAQAEQAGRAFGAFQRQLADYDGPPLHVVIPGFHDTVQRMSVLESAAQTDSMGRAAAVRTELAHVLEHRTSAIELDALRRDAALPARIVHNDAKISNVLFDVMTGEALCVVDLDTVMPGLSCHDFGDMVRSMTTSCAEDEPDLDRVDLQLPFFEALSRGYLSEAGGFLSRVERQHLVSGARLIVLEQAARFLTDYLHGDRYYKTTRPAQNLDRCRVQVQLFDLLSRQEDRLRAILDHCAD